MGYLEVLQPMLPQAKSRAFPGPDTARHNARRHHAILDTEPEDAFTQLTMLASELFGSPMAAIKFLDVDRQWFKASCGIDMLEMPIDQSFTKFVIQSSDVFVVKDARLDPRFVDNPNVVDGPKIRFCAGIRINAADGTPIGGLCVMDTEPRPAGITPTQDLALRYLASQVEALLEQRMQLAIMSELSEQLCHVAEHDGLTGLINREPFHQHMIAALNRARESNTRIALMFIDVDHFKQVNDTLGHDVGDALLRSFAARLRSILRKSDKIARLGGDEFGAMLCDINNASKLDRLVSSVEQRLNEPIRHKGRLIECHASIGVAIFPDHANTADQLMKCGDLALAAAKDLRGRAVTYDPKLSEQFERETKMLGVARWGIKTGQIVPHYQPKIDLEGGQLVGLEALVRCTQPNGELLLPESFAHALEDRELSRQIGEIMRERALDDIKAWSDRRYDFGHVALNTSISDFHADDFAERLLNGLQTRNLKPAQIEIEVTEGVFLGRGADYVARALNLLSEAGVRISLDDFGTGYASLKHLKQFPVNAIKIDRSFVDGIGKCPDDTTIVKALIGLGRSLGIETIAEGLETEKQVAFVRSHGCSVGQGFYFGRAMPAELVPSSLSDWTQIAAVS